MMSVTFSTATVSAISLILVVMDIQLSSGIKVVDPEFGHLRSRNRQSPLIPRFLDLPRFRGVSDKADNNDRRTFSEVGQHGEIPGRISRDTTIVRVSSADTKPNQPGILVYRPRAETGRVHLPESRTTLPKIKLRRSSRSSSTSLKNKRDVAWIYHRKMTGTNSKNPGDIIGEQFRLFNDPRELADSAANNAGGAPYDVAVTSSDGETWKEFGNLVAAADKSGYEVSLDVEPSEVASEIDHEKPDKSKQKLGVNEDSDTRGKRTGNEEEDDDSDVAKSDSRAIISTADPIREWGKREWGTDSVRVWGKRASGSSDIGHKRPWDTDTVRVWGKRAWEIDPVRVWGKRAWEMDPVRVWGKRAWEMDPVRVWGKRAWEMDPVRVWGKRAWEMDPVRVWGKRAWEMDPVRVWDKRAWEMDPVRVWGKRAWEMDPVRVWGKRAWEMDPVRVWGKRAWEMDPVRVWGKRD